MEKELLENIKKLLLKYGLREEESNKFCEELVGLTSKKEETAEDEEKEFDIKEAVMSVIGKDFDLEKDKSLKEAIEKEYK